MKLEDAKILIRYPVPEGAGFSIVRNSRKVIVTYNIPGSGKLRLTLQPDDLDISSWVSSLGGYYLFSTGAIQINGATIELLAGGIMPERINYGAADALPKDVAKELPAQQEDI